MTDSKPIPVRLSVELIGRTDRAARRLGNTRAGVIKLCLASFLEYFETHGERVALPLNWKEILDQLDGRTKTAKTAAAAAPAAKKTAVKAAKAPPIKAGGRKR